MTGIRPARAIVPHVLLLVLLVSFDQGTKEIARRTIAHSPPKIFAGDTFRIQYAENRGGFLSLGAGLSERGRFLLFVVVSTAGLILLAFFGFRGGQGTVYRNALTLVVSGGVSNLFDRVFYDGVVVDFMNMGIGPLRTGVFNFADTFIMAGAGWLLLQHFRREKVGTNDTSRNAPPGGGARGGGGNEEEAV